jgi:monovalent cation/proton antiporter MnhG/PhaG subunit
MRDVAVAVALVVGVAAQLLACLGVTVMRNAFDRLHYTGPTIVAAAALAAAVLIREGFSLVADKGIMLAVVVAITSPVIVQAMARAARTSERGSLDATAPDVERVG